tara:strand:- start:566 stop:706 length:141 start_codon:yes stop_codon:yes gene_type:complete
VGLDAPRANVTDVGLNFVGISLLGYYAGNIYALMCIIYKIVGMLMV